MKTTSTRKVILCQDREGVVEEYIQIQIHIEKKDDIAKNYVIKTQDFIIREDGGLESVKNRYGQNQEKYYYKTYEEYDTQKEQLLQAYPSDLTGSELDDYLLLMALKYNLTIEPIYGLNGEDWE